MFQKSFKNDGFEYQYSRKSAVAQREYDRQEAVRTKRLLEVPAAVSSRRLPKLSQSRCSSRSSTRSHSRCSSTTPSPRQSGPSSPPHREQHIFKGPTLLTARSSSLRARGVATDDVPLVKKSVNCIPDSPRMTFTPTQGAARTKILLPPLPSQHLPSNGLRDSSESLVRIGSPVTSLFRDLDSKSAECDKLSQPKQLNSANAVKDWLAEAHERLASVLPSNLLNENLPTIVPDGIKTECADTVASYESPRLENAIIAPDTLPTNAENVVGGLKVNLLPSPHSTDVLAEALVSTSTKSLNADLLEQETEKLAQEKGTDLALIPGTPTKEGDMEDLENNTLDAKDLRASATSYASDFEDESFLRTFTKDQEATARPEDLRLLKRKLHPGDLDMEDVPFVSADAVQQSQYEQYDDDFEDDFEEE